MNVIDFAALSGTPLQHDPYEHMVVSRCLKAELIESVTKDFPKINKPGLFPLSLTKAGPTFHQFIKELDGPEFESTISESFGIPLQGKPKLFTMRGQCHIRDGNIHTDSTNKILTVLVYLNHSWSEDGGRLRVLRNGKDLSNYAKEISPVAGTLFAFRRSEKSFHGHEPFEGKRQSIQLNWMINSSTRNRELARHRVSSIIKSINPFI